jgi:hypothetical protein
MLFANRVRPEQSVPSLTAPTRSNISKSYAFSNRCYACFFNRAFRGRTNFDRIREIASYIPPRLVVVDRSQNWIASHRRSISFRVL